LTEFSPTINFTYEPRNDTVLHAAKSAREDRPRSDAERTVMRRLQDFGDAALASDDGPIFSTVAKLVEALERSIPEGSQNAKRKMEAL
jgi:hypothetical protein